MQSDALACPFNSVRCCICLLTISCPVKLKTVAPVMPVCSSVLGVFHSLFASTVCPHSLLTCRDNGIARPAARGQHRLLPGPAEEAERRRQRRKCLLLPLQHLLGPGDGDAGGQRQHGRADVRGSTTPSLGSTTPALGKEYFSSILGLFIYLFYLKHRLLLLHKPSGDTFSSAYKEMIKRNSDRNHSLPPCWLHVPRIAKAFTGA